MNVVNIELSFPIVSGRLGVCSRNFASTTVYGGSMEFPEDIECPANSMCATFGSFGMSCTRNTSITLSKFSELFAVF